MKLKKISTLCLAASTIFAASSAMAWESGDHSTSASVALTTDYVWRGMTQTNYKEAIQGSFDYAHSSGLYAGVWASNVDFNAPGTVEIDTYAGFGNEIGDTGIGYDVGFLRYIYPGTTTNADWNEYHATASYSFLSASVNYSSDVYNSGTTGLYYTLGAEYTLPQDFTVSANVGWNHFNNPGAATSSASTKTGADYNIGVSKDFAGFGFDARYYGTDKKLERQAGIGTGKDASDSFVFTISKSM